MDNIFSVKDKNILVTGASSGLGQYIAEFYASQGANIIICARRQARLTELKQNIQTKYPVKVHSYTVDVTDRAAVKTMLNDLSDQSIAIDVLVNNAGVGANNRFLDTPDEEWDTVLDTNLKAPWLCTQEVVRHMIQHKIAGSIINISSILSESVNMGIAPYCASKAALRHLTQVMAVELARFNVRTNAIAPGYVVTELNEDFLTSDAGQQILKKVPMRRFVDFSDLNGVLLLFASQASKGMTGVEVKVDGGHSCTPI